ncbi:MAG: 30S ribosomal protein S8 [bacterium]|nr:30S ribosomal protein S8 [bacterium]
MTMTDPIADLITRIRNANRAGHEKADIPLSRTKETIVSILKREGFINDFRVIEEKPVSIIRVYMRYGDDKKRFLTGIQRVSTPGLRHYVNKDNVPKVMGGIGIAIITTSQGIMADYEARRKGVGGEVLCEVW